MHWLVKPLLALSGLLIASSSAMASDTLWTCSVLDTDPDFPVTLSFVQSFDAEAMTWSVTTASVQIIGDIGYSTEDSEPSNHAIINVLEADARETHFMFHVTYDEYDVDVAEVRVVTLYEGQGGVTAGALSVGAGGVWPIVCESEE